MYRRQIVCKTRSAAAESSIPFLPIARRTPTQLVSTNSAVYSYSETVCNLSQFIYTCHAAISQIVLNLIEESVRRVLRIRFTSESIDDELSEEIDSILFHHRNQWMETVQFIADVFIIGHQLQN